MCSNITYTSETLEISLLQKIFIIDLSVSHFGGLTRIFYSILGTSQQGERVQDCLACPDRFVVSQYKDRKITHSHARWKTTKHWWWSCGRVCGGPLSITGLWWRGRCSRWRLWLNNIVIEVRFGLWKFVGLFIRHQQI